MIDLNFSGIGVPKPQVVILFEYSEVTKLKQQVIPLVLKTLSEKFNKYKFDAVTTNGIDNKYFNNVFSTMIFNAHILYEAVSFENNEIIYPEIKAKIENCIKETIDDYKKIFHDEKLNEDELAVISLSKKRSEEIISVKNMVNILNTPVHTKYSLFSKSFHACIGDEVHVLIKDYSGDNILACNNQANYTSIVKAVKALEKIEVEATIQAKNALLNNDFKYSEQFKSTNVQQYSFDYFSEDKNVLKFINEVKEKLEKEVFSIDVFPELNNFLIKWFGKSFHSAIHDELMMKEF